MKNVWSFIAVALMLSPTVIPSLYPPPTDPLSLFKWKLVLILSSCCAVIAFGLHLLFLHRDEQKRESRQEEKNMELVKAVAAEVERRLSVNKPALAPPIEPLPAPPAVTELGMTSEDPRIYIEVKESADNMFRRTPFVLSNQGKEAAHKIRIEPFKLVRKTVKFPIMETVPAGEKREVLPSVDKVDSSMIEHDIFHWLLKDWDASGEGLTDEWPVQIVVVYSDFTLQKHFTAIMNLVFHPIRYLLETSHEWPPHDTVLWEFRDIEFKRIN